MLKLPMQEAPDLRPSCPEKQTVNPRWSCYLMPQLDQVDLPLNLDWNESTHLRGRCSTVLGSEPAQWRRQ